MQAGATGGKILGAGGGGLALSLRNPAWVIIGLAQPVLYLVFFGPLLEPLAAALTDAAAARRILRLLPIRAAIALGAVLAGV